MALQGRLGLEHRLLRLDDVDWEELALKFGKRLRDRSEVLETARRHGLLALLESRGDDLPKN